MEGHRLPSPLQRSLLWVMGRKEGGREGRRGGVTQTPTYPFHNVRVTRRQGKEGLKTCNNQQRCVMSDGEEGGRDAGMEGGTKGGRDGRMDRGRQGQAWVRVPTSPVHKHKALWGGISIKGRSGTRFNTVMAIVRGGAGTVISCQVVPSIGANLCLACTEWHHHTAQFDAPTRRKYHRLCRWIFHYGLTSVDTPRRDAE